MKIPMKIRTSLGRVGCLILGVALLVSVAEFAQGCNTAQSPKAQVNDAQVTTQVKSKLASDVKASTLTDISVNTTNGVVTLTGQVETSEIKQRAETVAASVPGVKRVNNDLQVTPKSASVR